MQASIGKELNSLSPSKLWTPSPTSNPVSDSGLCKYGGGEEGGRISCPSGSSERPKKDGRGVMPKFPENEVGVGVAEPDSTGVDIPDSKLDGRMSNVQKENI